MTADQNSKSAAERARELLTKLPPRPWTPQYQGIADAEGETIIDDVGMPGLNDDLRDFVVASPDLVTRLLQDLATATERAERAEKELATSRAALDKMTTDLQEAREVICEAAPFAWIEHHNGIALADEWQKKAEKVIKQPLPLPPKEM